MKYFQTGFYAALALLLNGCLSAPTLTPLEAMPIAKPPQTITFKLKGYKPPSGRLFKQFFIINNSIKVANGVLSLSTSRDGLADSMKSAQADYGFSLSGPYSANTYFSDLFLYLSGIKSTQQPLLYCASNLTLSTTNDGIIYTDHRDGMQKFIGLRDCEKSYMGLDYHKFDFDGDGVPDYLELHCGMNPKNGNDASLSISGDGVTNIEKCKRNIPVDENADSQPNKLFAYNYDSKLQTDGTTDITVTNIPIINGGLDNFFTFYLVEVDSASLQTYLYTAFTNLAANSADRIFQFNYWATDAAHATNQELVFP